MHIYGCDIYTLKHTHTHTLWTYRRYLEVFYSCTLWIEFTLLVTEPVIMCLPFEQASECDWPRKSLAPGISKMCNWSINGGVKPNTLGAGRLCVRLLYMRCRLRWDCAGMREVFLVCRCFWCLRRAEVLIAKLDLEQTQLRGLSAQFV